MQIRVDDLQGADIHTLLQDHLDTVAIHSPPGSRHALNLNELKKPDITFWTAWDNEELLGCGALKELDTSHGEIKSMKTAKQHLRKGVAAGVLSHIIEVAKQRGYQRLSLETGSMAAFQPACNLYERFGFEYCEPFAHYKPDPNSVFMTKNLAAEVIG